MTAQPGAVVFVAGVSRGIGAATAQALLARDHHVVGASRSRPDFSHPRLRWIETDLNDDAAVGAAFDTVEGANGRLDGLINSAGQYYAGALEEHTIEQVQAQFDAYFFSVVRTTRAALPLMRKQRSGRIINIGSTACFAPLPFHSIYTASKFALQGLSEALRFELAPLGIQVTVVQTTSVATGAVAQVQRAPRELDDYAPARSHAIEAFRAGASTGHDPRWLAQRIAQLMKVARLAPSYRFGALARFLYGLRNWAPAVVLHEVTARAFLPRS
jgi:NAD(P)-dependent dehydrogenase (short-subunit alcohol dehydrogenase family)